MSKTTYLKKGSTTTVIESDFQGDVLPIGVYNVSHDLSKGFFLTDRESLDLPLLQKVMMMVHSHSLLKILKLRVCFSLTSLKRFMPKNLLVISSLV